MKQEKTVMAAVRSLRIALGLTQTEFGRSLGRSLPTIQRWETLRPPRGAALAELYRLAKKKSLTDTATIFRKMLFAELGEVADALPVARAWVTLQALKDEVADLPPTKKNAKITKTVQDLEEAFIAMGATVLFAELPKGGEE